MLKKFFTRTWSGLLRSALLGSALLVSTLLIASNPMQASAANVVNSNFEAYFSNFNTSLWESASWANGNPFNCTWKPSQVTFKNGKMVLAIDRDSGGSYPYKGGEYRTTQFFGFGYYEVRMKAIKNTGVVSSFFTYTGPSDNNPWDEIDIEFLGKDTTKVQFNWYKNGSANNEYLYNLGFDASQAFHTYGFEWRSNFISYYVDGKKVYTGTRNIPQTPSKIMMNVWPGTGVNDWLGAFDGRTPLTAEYEYVKYFPNGVPNTTNPTPTPARTSAPTPTKAPATVVKSDFSAYFSNFNTSLWESASWANGNPFNCTWKPSQVTFNNGKMVLAIDKDYGGSYPYKGGEYRTTQFFGFGYYEVRMKAIKNTGVVSSFFTYTGQSDNNPWDEIDIEFLGKDTTKVQFNWYKNGSANNEYLYNLGFDASQAFHTYGFEWRSNFISYYVDGKKVYTGTRNIPQTPGKIMMNVWPGTGVNDWLGAFDGKTPLTAEYEYVKYFPNGVPYTTNPTPTPTPTYTPTPTKAPATVVNSDFAAYFSNYNTNLWESASWANGNPFNCTWKPSQVTFNNGKMVLNLDRDSGGTYPYKSGEYRTTQFFGFGYYEVRMKATKNTGVVSSFFTYTGQSDNNPWDEIDIEFLGKDTTKVQYNWFKNGSGNNEYIHNLGFDASQAFHTYGFEWRSNFISYYVDGVKVYTGTRNIPQTPGKIMMNLWPGTGVDGWLGAFDGKTPLTAEYEYVKYFPNGVPNTNNPTPTPYQPNVIVGDVNGDGSVNSIDFGFYRMYLIGSINDFPAANDLKAGDLDGNGSINSIDFGYMRKFLLGLIDRFPAS